MSDLAQRVLPTVHSLSTLAELRHSDRGRLAAVETEAAVYVGEIRSITFHTYGNVRVTFKRGESESECTAPPETVIAFANEEEQ